MNVNVNPKNNIATPTAMVIPEALSASLWSSTCVWSRSPTNTLLVTSVAPRPKQLTMSLPGDGPMGIVNQETLMVF